jgi:hypothetical protein
VTSFPQLPQKSISEIGFTAFPELKSPEKLEDRALPKMCPLLFGVNAIPIEPMDDTYRRLRKEQLQAGARFIYKFRIRMEIGSYQSSEFLNFLSGLDDMRAVTLDLWATDPRNLTPRLEELVIVAKDAELFTNTRVITGTDPPQQLDQAMRHRLEVEAALWKVLHPKAGR